PRRLRRPCRIALRVALRPDRVQRRAALHRRARDAAWTVRIRRTARRRGLPRAVHLARRGRRRSPGIHRARAGLVSRTLPRSGLARLWFARLPRTAPDAFGGRAGMPVTAPATRRR